METPTNTIVSPEFVHELLTSVEDTIQYVLSEFMENGELYSGETSWKVLEVLAIAKQCEFRGEISVDLD